MSDELARWAAGRAPDLLERAEAEAVAALRDALLRAALGPRRAAEPPTPPAPERSPETSDGLWAYGVVRAGAAMPAERGVAGGTVERVRVGDLEALASRVPLAGFGAEPLRRNLNDIQWLERVAREHETVLERALALTTVVPLRLCTIFESEDRLRAMLEREHDRFREALEVLDGRQEWGVKLLVDHGMLEQLARAGSREAADMEAEIGEREGGGAYLLRRRLERHVREAAGRLATQIAEEVHARLQDWAIDAVTRPPQNRELSGHEGDMLLNGAYLVSTDRVDGLRALVAELEERHQEVRARIELTGPWPPYNFVPGGDTASIA
jgi:Gas vesicle synthesis protein GvpL/GvpF